LSYRAGGIGGERDADLRSGKLPAPDLDLIKQAEQAGHASGWRSRSVDLERVDYDQQKEDACPKLQQKS
jgi:hypothetical protein